MTRITITCGHEYDKDGGGIPVFRQREALEAILSFLATKVGGVTVLETYGAWFDEKAERTVTEKGWQFVLFAREPINAAHLARFVLNTLNQSAVVLNVEHNVTTVMIDNSCASGECSI